MASKKMPAASRLLSAMVLLSFVCGGCALPYYKRVTTSQQLSRLSQGMSHSQVRKSVGTEGEPIFSFTESGGEYRCGAFYSRDTGVLYYLLWVNDELTAITSDRQHADLPGISAMAGTDDALPHQGGFRRLRQPFTGPGAEVAAIDFSEMKPGFRPMTVKKELAGLWMWHPIIILSLPFTVPSIAWGNDVCSKMYRLRLGMSSTAVVWTAGKPEKTLGDADVYQVWVYKRATVGTEGGVITVSVGMRSGYVVWLRYRYNACADHRRHASIQSSRKSQTSCVPVAKLAPVAKTSSSRSTATCRTSYALNCETARPTRFDGSWTVSLTEPRP